MQIQTLRLLVRFILVLTLIFTSINFTEVSAASSKTMNVESSMNRNQFHIRGKGGWFNKSYSFTIKNTGRSQIAVYQGLVVMGTKGLVYLGNINPGQTRTISFKAKGNIDIGYVLQKTGGGVNSAVITANDGLSVE